MKYALLFCTKTSEYEAAAAMSAEEIATASAPFYEWFTEYGPRMVEGHELQTHAKATTVRFNQDHQPLVVDGPFTESGEVVGGYSIVDVEDFDEVLAMAKTWPGGAVEIRPVVER